MWLTEPWVPIFVFVFVKLSGVKELSKIHIDILAKNDINNREDLADLSVDELLEMIELSKEDAGKIIMDAREPWFNQD
mgnify:CR=1 FL=1